MLGMFSAMDLAASGLSAERVRMNTVASNLANARTTRTEDGGPYRRIDPVFEAVALRAQNGVTPTGVTAVRVREIVQDQRAPRLVHDPGHPDADAAGFVRYPNVDVVQEMVDMIAASRAYEAGVTSIESVKSMSKTALGIGR